MTRGRLLDAVRIVVAVLVLAGVVVAVWRNWGEVSAHLRDVPMTTLVGAFVVGLLAPIFSLLGWRVLLADLGTRLALPAGASVFFVGQLGKYLPGSVWSVVAQADLGSRLGVPRRRMGIVGLLSILLSVLTGAIVGVPALPLLLARSGELPSVWWFAPALVLLLLLWPRLLNRGIAHTLRILRREPLEHELTAPAIALTTLWFVLAWLSAGLSVLVLAHSLSPDTPVRDLVVTSICGFALASAIGMFSIIVPAGVGVRDGVLALLLGALMPLPAAFAIVVISRFFSVVADVVVAAVGWSWARSHHLLGSRS
ncbi:MULTISPECIES: lysylphosphatidylglycerol synthase domain-containing protein [unclassified Knoellia]|uniref:lysylphosphatidylglycerol synthase domain-containing protein n=1 Tax=Knoellia altitudinis TaxID=3404795 RepID=UPI0036241BD6